MATAAVARARPKREAMKATDETVGTEYSVVRDATGSVRGSEPTGYTPAV